MTNESEIDQMVDIWKEYTDTIDDWRNLVEGTAPKPNGCGPIYKLKNPLDRPNEDFSICDMRNLKITEPHYHPDGVIEIYIVLRGYGLIVIGEKVMQIHMGDVVTILSETSHYTVPGSDLVLGVINTPPFKPELYIKLDESISNPKVGFDAKQFAEFSSNEG